MHLDDEIYFINKCLNLRKIVRAVDFESLFSLIAVILYK